MLSSKVYKGTEMAFIESFIPLIELSSRIAMPFFKKSKQVTPDSKSSQSSKSKFSSMFKSSGSSSSKPVGKVLVTPYRTPLTMGMSRM
jgi:hypothetical protein